MKEERLKKLKRCLNMIQNAHDVLEEVRDEEQEAYDNLPEGLQYRVTPCLAPCEVWYLTYRMGEEFDNDE